jgi:hypothetical protein
MWIRIIGSDIAQILDESVFPIDRSLSALRLLGGTQGIASGGSEVHRDVVTVADSLMTSHGDHGILGNEALLIWAGSIGVTRARNVCGIGSCIPLQ